MQALSDQFLGWPRMRGLTLAQVRHAVVGRLHTDALANPPPCLIIVQL